MQTKTQVESDINQTLGLGKSARSGKKKKRWLVLLLLIAAAVFFFSSRGKTGQEKPMQYKTEEIQLGSLTETVTATGNLEPTNEVEVGSELSGILKSVEADYNDNVKIGQVLARLDTSKLEAQVTQARASLEAAKAKVLQAQATINETQSKLLQLQKVRELSGNKVPSQVDLDAAQAAFERATADKASAEASVSQAQATLNVYETDLSKADIVSPINGVVLTRSMEKGQTVAASFQAPVLFTLAEDLTQMELHVDVDEADIGQVLEGQEATFSVDAYPDRTFQARITQVRYGSNTVDGVVTYETVLKVDNTDLSLRPGMTATAEITVKKVENALLVPSAALRFSPPSLEENKSSGSLLSKILPRPPLQNKRQQEAISTDKKKQTVWILQEGKPVSIPVQIGATNGVMAEITGGDIKAGTAIIIETITVKK